MRGIPQGSCLGLLLLNLFIYDIFHVIEICQVFHYADDNTLSAESDTIEEDSSIARKWFSNNSMKVNPDKTPISFS